MLLFFHSMRGFLHRVREWLRESKNAERFWCFSVLAIVLIGVLMPTGETHAAELLSTALNYLLAFVAFLLEKVIIMIGKLVLFLVKIVIVVAQYNQFTKAAPVQTGWPIIRDVFNMFFIVILLVSAFSTIIGYDKYHYSTIIKKFFLMAALINFSLPLFGMAIDFSQILMLTFVNGFRPAAAGNFISILQLDKIMKIEKVDLGPDDGTTAIENPMVQKVTAMMFGVIILGISATILAIMAVYLVARIVGLWILLITSPGALFVTGLPSSLQGKIPGFGGDWWSKFWGLLVGGPIMAFFLWLSLATASQVGPTFTSGSYAGEAEADAAEQYFQTAIGTVENFGAYIVAVVMLFQGLSNAVSATNSVSPAAGKLAGRIRDYGVGTTKFLAYGGVAAGGAYAARQVGGAATELGSAADRRYGITKGIGTGIQTIGIKTGWTGAAKVGATIAGTRGRAVKREQEKFEEMTKGLAPGKRMDFAQARINSILSNADERKGLQELLTKDAFSVAGTDHLMKKYDAEAEKKFGPKPADNDKEALKEYTQKVEAYKTRRLTDERKGMLDKYRDAAKGNDDKEKWIKERQEAMPSYAKDVSAFVAEESGKDPMYFRKVKPTEFVHAGLGVGTLAAAGFSGNELSDPDGQLAKAMKGQDKKAKMLRSWKDVLQKKAEEQGTTIEGLLKNTDLNDKALLEKFGLKDMVMVEAEGTANGYRPVTSGGTTEVATSTAKAASAEKVTGTIIRNEEQILAQKRALERAQDRIREVEKRSSGPDRDAEVTRLNGEVRQAQQGMFAAGAAADDVFKINRDGNFEKSEERQTFEATVKNAFETNSYSKVDLSVINRNMEGTNDARRAVARQADIGKLASSYQIAKAQGDKSGSKNIADIVRAVEKEGGVFDHAIDRYNSRPGSGGTIDKKTIAKIGAQYNSAKTDADRERATQALQNALKNANGAVVMTGEDAGLLAKHSEIKGELLLRNYGRQASNRATSDIKAAIKSRAQSKAEEKDAKIEAATPNIEPARPGVRSSTRAESQMRRRSNPNRPTSQPPNTSDIDKGFDET